MMHARSLLRPFSFVALICACALPEAPALWAGVAHASSLPACAQTQGCLADEVNPNSGRALGGCVTILNQSRLPIIAVLRPDGALYYLPTVIGQTQKAALTIEPVSFADTLASIQRNGSLVPSTVLHVTVKLDGTPAYAIAPRLRLAFSARFVGRPVVVGEGTFEQAQANAHIGVAAGGAISSEPPSAAVAVPLPGFVLQVKVLGRWVTVANGNIPAAAAARFAQVPGKTWTCHGPGGSCRSAS
jgi:hypothetical protein